MKICFIIPKGLPVPCVKGGAIERLVTDIIEQNEKDKLLDITVVSVYDKQAESLSNNYSNTKFIYIKNDIKYIFKGILVRIKRIFGKKSNTYNEYVLDKIKNGKYDYIIVEDGAYSSFTSYLKYFKKSQMILHMHHAGISSEAADKTFDAFLGVSDYVCQKFKSTSNISNIWTLRNGINTENFDKQITESERENIRNKLKFKQDDFIVIFCGRLIQEKGVLELVKAVKNINNPKIKLMIVGSINFANNGTSEYLNKLKQEVATSNDRIRFTGYVDNLDLYKYYQSADMGIVPSLCEEAAALVSLEIMISRIPLVITNVGGAPEFVPENTTIISKENIVKNISDAILKLYESNDVSQITNTSYTYAKKFNTQKLYKDLIELLNRKESIND